MEVNKIVLSEGGILLIVCLVFACYYKSVNKLIGGSNCSEISCCGCSLKRQPLSEEAALEVMNNQPHNQSIPQLEVILEKIASDIENSIVNPGGEVKE